MNQPPISNLIRKYPLKVYGHKFRLLGHILALIPPSTRTFCDLLGCTGVVGWKIKQALGATITSNDVRQYAYLQLRALVANNTTVLTEDDLATLRRSNPRNEHNVLRCYPEIFGKRNADFLDLWASNIPLLKNTLSQDIAAFVPIATIASRLMFDSQNYTPLGTLTGDQSFKDVDVEAETLDFARRRMPSLLHDNGAKNEVFSEDAVTLISRINADVAYIDSPYCTRAGRYLEDMKFVESLSRIMTGHGATITNPFTSRLPYPPHTNFGTRGSALMGFSTLFQRARHIPRLIISYNTTSQIAPSEIVRLAQMHGWIAKIETTIKYPRPTTKKGKNTDTQEVLIVCRGRGRL